MICHNCGNETCGCFKRTKATYDLVEDLRSLMRQCPDFDKEYISMTRLGDRGRTSELVETGISYVKFSNALASKVRALLDALENE